MCSANHGREHDELGADTLFTNRRLRVRQPPRLKRSPTTDPSSHKNDPSSSPAQRPYLSYSPPGPITGHILYRALISPSHPTICRSSLDSLHIIFKATYRRLNRYSYPATCSPRLSSAYYPHLRQTLRNSSYFQDESPRPSSVGRSCHLQSNVLRGSSLRIHVQRVPTAPATSRKFPCWSRS